MKKPSYELQNYQEIYDFYSEYQPVRKFTRGAYKTLNRIMKPTVTYDYMNRDELDYLSDTNAPIILALNHQSDRHDQWVSAAVGSQILPRKVGDISILVKSTFYTGELLDEMKVSRSKLVRPLAQRGLTNFVNNMGSIPLYRPGDQSDEQLELSRAANEYAFDMLAERMQRGRPVGIYPEGTADTSDPTRINPIKAGIAHLAMRSLVSGKEPAIIVPIGVSYPEYIRRVNRKGNESVQPRVLKGAHAHIGEILHLDRDATLDEIRYDIGVVLQRSVDTAFEIQQPTTE